MGTIQNAQKYINQGVKPRVLVAVPNTGWIHIHVAFALLRMIQDQRVIVTIILPAQSPQEHNMQKIVNQFLAGSYDYLLSIDSDNPPRRNPLDLVFLGLDVVACPTPQWVNKGDGDYPICWMALDWDEKKQAYREHPVKQTLQEVDAVGNGCILISREVLETIKEPFQRTWANGLVDTGGDFNFCKKAKAAGFNIWAHYDYPCDHFKELNLNEVVMALKGIPENA